MLHAPRQTGKTSCLLALMEYLNSEGRYRALYANLEAAQGARENVGEAMRAILSVLGSQARDYLDDPFLKSCVAEILLQSGPFGALGEALTRWSAQSSKPIQEKSVITGGSAFNIKAESLRLGNFSRSEVEALYRQHTEETGQAFEAEALDKAWDLTCGQPWLVNALAYEAHVSEWLRAGTDRCL